MPYTPFLSPKLYQTGAVLLLAWVCFSACSERQKPPSGDITVVDDLGREIRLDSLPGRIISLAPSLTEIVYTLGAEEKLVGVSSYCDFPPEASEKPSVGSVLEPSLEAISELQPDLVLITVAGNSKATFQQLDRLNIPSFVVEATSLDGVLHSIEGLGAILGKEQQAISLVDSLQAITQTYRQRPAGGTQPKVLMLLSLQPIICAGQGTFAAELISLSDGEIAAPASPAYPVLSREYIIDSDPDVILVSSDLGVDRKYLLDTFPEWKSIQAFQDGIVTVVSADLTQRPGPRLWQGLSAIESILSSWSASRIAPSP